jgi:hypothetical protein
MAQGPCETRSRSPLGEGEAMRELTSVVLEMERQGKRLQKLLRVDRLNTMTWKEFREMVTIVDRLMVNFTDFNVLRFGKRKGRKSGGQ